MRTRSDRLRHTILFEVLGLLTCTPLAAWILNREMARIGVMSMTISMTAMACNYIFNLAFDHSLRLLGRPVHIRPTWMRVLHATLFELFLLLFTVPFVAWWLDMPLQTAFITDIGFAFFFLVYAFAYNWIYDRVFPMPVEQPIRVNR